MVPTAFVFLDALPLTPNGKVDRRALPAPNRADAADGVGYVAPRDHVEESLAGIWSQALGVPQVGIHDNFFALGGDSIISIQIIARASQLGLRLTPRQIFQHQTIAELAGVAGQAPATHSEQGPVTGSMPLTPIQRWFFEHELPERQHWNQAMVLEVHDRAGPALIERAFERLIAQHDALRLRFAPGADGWRQYHDMPGRPIPFSCVDLAALPEAEQMAQMAASMAALQASLDLANGPLLRATLFDLGTGWPARLLIVIHHLAIDGVSWRILLDDLQTLVEAALRGEAGRLPPKTSSFKAWATGLTQYTRSGRLQPELDAWLAVSRAHTPRLPLDFPAHPGANSEASARSVSVALDAEETQALLHELPAAYRAQINDVMMTALAQAFAHWTGAGALLVDLEGHGREELWDGLDISRTVGWFTAIFPVLLECEHGVHPVAALRAIKEQLSYVPRRGIGYGLLRYLGDENLAAKLRALPQAEVSFNYLGSNSATREINRTSEVRAPIALAAAGANASLLRMVGDMRGYLALGDKALRDDYVAAQQEFEQNLRELEQRSRSNGAPIQGLDTLQQQYAAWQQLPPRLFDLHDDQLQREPALRMLIKEGSPLIVQISQNIKLLIDARAQGDQTAEGVALIKDRASFQGSFTAMISGLRGWVTTQRTAFYTEYISNSIINEEAWRKLLRARASLPPDQQQLLDTIDARRQELLPLADQIISTAAGEHVREDLFQFREQAVPPANAMLATLGTITREQQDLLKSDLQNGSDDLLHARQQTLVAGAVIALIALALSFIFRANIAGPIRRLTRVAEQIHGGDLAVEAQVESRDEIGRLATTFNRMTGQLRQTLAQVRKEKKRADDLLDVVIPIGVALSSEKDFNHLLEKIVLEARAFCNANAGILYLRTDDDHLKYMIVRNDLRQSAFGGTSGNPIPFAPLPLYDPESGAPNHRSVTAHAALTGSSINIPNAYAATEFDINVPQDFDGQTGYPSLLTIPLKNGASEVIGVLQLIDALDPPTGQVIPFDANLQRLSESLSSLAVAALEAYVREQSLRHEIRQLRIEIDDVKRQQQVEAIVETDFFQNLRAKAQAMRSRNRGTGRQEATEEPVQLAQSDANQVEVPRIQVE